jgi:hypothetical protein
VAKINGVTTLMGNGVTGTGSQRVTVASDNTPFPIKLDQTTPGTTNNVSVSATTGTDTSILIKDDPTYGDGVTAGILSVHSRVFNGTNYDRNYGYPRFSYARKTADGQVKATAGFVHSIVVTPTAATATAGVITIYDSAAESGTVIQTIFIPTNNSATIVIPLDVVAGTGIYVGYDATVTNHATTIAYA